MPKAIITGVSGQDGAYLAKLLLDKGYEVLGGVRRNSNAVAHRLVDLGIDQHVKKLDWELTDYDQINRDMRTHQPDEFYNLAAQSFVGVSWNQPVSTSKIDGMGVLYTLEAIRNHSPGTKFYQASTSEMFGLVQAIPQSETTPFHPRSPYGVAKLFAHWMTVNYRESYDMYAVSGILFNHESPLRGLNFVTRKITHGLAMVALNKQDCIYLGNIDAKRDWGYAAEYVQGMWLMLQQDKPDDYVLASGETYTVREFIEHAGHILGMKIVWQGSGTDEIGIDKVSGRTVIRISEEFYRPAEVDLLLGDPTKAKTQLGWAPKTDVKALAEMMVKSDYERVKNDKVMF